MKTTELSGHKVQVKRGTVETIGNEIVAGDSSTFAGLTFTDGETVRRTIMVESSIVPYLSPGTTGTFVFADGPAGRAFVVAVDVEGRGLRVADARPFQKARNGGVLPVAGVLGITVFIAFGAVIVPLMAPLALIPAGFSIKGIFTLTGLSKLISIIKIVDRTRHVPDADRIQGTLAAA
ncbi:hypothetical protein [Devosia elaeis]|uniref:Uncharacterized protein n=1 Tax=Devosia elaeis TaxID=1770058 RepID=A0A178I4V0_9HYPH|nr:hypothetical protein [Devosia elaeis]OAM84261.1 hypothetical protein A3840_00375 [Devosia elaeis]